MPAHSTAQTGWFCGVFRTTCHLPSTYCLLRANPRREEEGCTGGQGPHNQPRNPREDACSISHAVLGTLRLSKTPVIFRGLPQTSET